MTKNYRGAWHRLAQPRLPFLATLIYLLVETNESDLVSHDLSWSNVLTSFIRHSKFEGKAGEDPSEHVTTFPFGALLIPYMMIIRLRLFQRHPRPGCSGTWYIELPRGDSFCLMTFL